jgi:aminoglycoside phosphotransferase (APT) family kinase protein
VSPSRKQPAAEVDVDEPLIRSLLQHQMPDLAELPLVLLASGWDNVIYRLGDDLVVRLPRRELAATLVEHELQWLPVLAPTLPLPIPAPIRGGHASDGYPWSWSVCPWLPGVAAEQASLSDTREAAATLGRFVGALHRPAPPDAPANPFRGVPLRDRAAVMLERIDAVADVIDGAAARSSWDELLTTPEWTGPPLWLHGDLHPLNVLVDNGRVSAVIDFGDLTAGDPATDLSVAWMMFSPAERSGFRDAAGDVDDHTWRRARGWALALALAYLANSADGPLLARIGERTIAAVLADN